MTTAQALVKFLDNQYVSFDGKETKFVDGIFTIFGHGIVCGLGEALDSDRGGLTVYQGKNEQGMAHVATAFAKQNNRRKIIACSSSIGPGAANMITAAATATVNHIPLGKGNAERFAEHLKCFSRLGISYSAAADNKARNNRSRQGFVVPRIQNKIHR